MSRTRHRTTLAIPLVGAGGEPVDLRRTFFSHGGAYLPPMLVGEHAEFLEITLPVKGGRPRMARLVPGRQRGKACAVVHVVGPPLGVRGRARIATALRHVLRLDEDLSPFYALAATDPDLAWVASGAGRMLRSPTLFEDVVKTVCTTNCAWSATTRMVSALVEHLGEPAPGAPSSGPIGRAFPTPAAMAGADHAFYRDVVRAGYRGRYLQALAEAVDSGEVELEAWGRATPAEIPDDELAMRLLALPGVGPYAAAHIMTMAGRYSRLILDSWTRPKYARMNGLRRATDARIHRRFRRYGRYAGLAFWLYLTRDWL